MGSRVKQTFVNLGEAPNVGDIFAICVGASDCMGIIKDISEKTISIEFLHHDIAKLVGYKAKFPMDTFQRCYGPLRPNNSATVQSDDYTQRLRNATTEYWRLLDEGDIFEMECLRMMSEKHNVELNDIANKVIEKRYPRD
jgi:hypothetical protein